MSNPADWSATQAARALEAGELSAEELAQACLGRIAERDGAVQAWQFVDEAQVLRQARERDAWRASGQPCGPLHGVPVGVKDVIDTGDMPTEDGTALHAGRLPDRDATAVAMLRAAGAVILGKTVTTELATYAPGKTRNPHDPARTPGGSSSGSAAAVAAGMVPLALGTQTNASVIRPASFCGVVGFKPSFGWLPRGGVLKCAPSLDSLGVFARTLDDAALCAELMVGACERDPAARPRARPPWLATLRGEPPMPPRLALVRTPMWERTAGDTREAFAELAEALGAQCQELSLPEGVAEAWELHRTVMEAEFAHHLHLEYERGAAQLSAGLRAQIERGRAVSALAYQQALARVPALQRSFAELFVEFDAILTPAAAGTAPAADSTGDPAFGTLWSLCGLPALSLPLMRGADGLPLGVQLVGAAGNDGRLLRTARWLAREILGDTP